MLGRTLAALCIAATLIKGAAAGPFEDGLAAAQQGDFASALRLLMPLAQQGNAAAEGLMGVFYANAYGVPRDYAEAMKWFKLAAEHGRPTAYSDIGIMYLNGEGVPKDLAEAVKWFRLGADRGDARGQHFLGVLYQNGLGVSQSNDEALKWYRIAAAQGYPDAQTAAKALEEISEAKAGQGDAASSEIEPSLPPLSQVSELADEDLGFGLLAATEMLTGGVGTTDAVWEELHEKGVKELGTFTNVVTSPDGKTRNQVFKRFEDLHAYVEKIRRSHEAYKAEISRRGFQPVGPTYAVKAGKGCSPDWFVSGEATTERIEFLFALHQKDKAFLGASVRETVVIIFPGGDRRPLVGKIDHTGIALVEVGGKCEMKLSLPR